MPGTLFLRSAELRDLEFVRSRGKRSSRGVKEVGARPVGGEENWIATTVSALADSSHRQSAELRNVNREVSVAAELLLDDDPARPEALAPIVSDVLRADAEGKGARGQGRSKQGNVDHADGHLDACGASGGRIEEVHFRG